MSEQEQACSTFDSRRSEMERKMCDMASEGLTDLHLQGEVCDVVIKVGEAEFNTHKIILCSCSPYFRALFTGIWATSKKQKYSIPGVSPEMMQLIIYYAYTHSVPLTEDNVAEVLAAGDQFLVQGIVQACCFFLEDQLCLNNCIGIWRLVDFYQCTELKQKALNYILYRFEEIAHDSKELLELTVEQLAVIIQNDHLNVKHESKVFETVLRWISHLPDQRQGHMSFLLPKVRLGLTSTDYVKNAVMSNDIVKAQDECMPIIKKAMWGFQSKNSVYSKLLSRPRLPPDILLVTGGIHAPFTSTSLEAYDTRADLWVTLSSDVSRAYHGAAVINNFVYLIGGLNRKYLKSAQRFDILTCTWHQLASMKSCRSYVSVAVLNGCIYAFGGFSGHKYSNTVERYDPEKDQWTMVAPMCTKRCGAGAAALNGMVGEVGMTEKWILD